MLKSILLKANSGERCAPQNFVLVVPLAGTCLPYLVPHGVPSEMIMERYMWNQSQLHPPECH